MLQQSNVPALPDGIRLGAAVTLTVPGTDLAQDVRLIGVDSEGSWFLSTPRGVELSLGVPVVAYVRKTNGEHGCFEARVRRVRGREGLPSTLVLFEPVPAGLAPDESTEELLEETTLEVEPLRVVTRSPGVGRPAVGEVLRIGAGEVLLRLRQEPPCRTLTLAIDPPEAFLQAKARELERTRPGTSHTYWRLQKVYSVYFAGIDTTILGDPIAIGYGESRRWLVHVRFEDEHPGCAELVRFVEGENFRAARQVVEQRRVEDTLMLEGFFN